MEPQSARHTHPLVIVAAIAVTLFSLVGIGAMLGWIPASTGQNAATSAAPAPVAQAPEQPKAGAQPDARIVEDKKPENAAARPQHKAPSRTASAPVPARATPATPDQAPAQVAQAMIPPPPPAKPMCAECGVIDSVREIEKPGKASGGGAIGGAIVGGVLGHQVGGGRGRDVMTVLGAVGGGVAGNQIEKNVTQSREYQITVRLEDGSSRVITQTTPPNWRTGDKVKVVNGVIQSNG